MSNSETYILIVEYRLLDGREIRNINKNGLEFFGMTFGATTQER